MWEEEKLVGECDPCCFRFTWSNLHQQQNVYKLKQARTKEQVNEMVAALNFSNHAAHCNLGGTWSQCSTTSGSCQLGVARSP